MVSERLEVRLDRERRRKIEEMAADKGTGASEIMRQLLDRGYEEWLQDRRRLALKRLMEIEIPDDVPDPGELSRQLDSTYDLPDLY